MERSPYCTQAAVHLIEGRAGTGKTSRLIALAVDLLEGGAQPEELLLFAATPAAARALEGRLAAHLDAGAAPRVTTVPAFALALLGCVIVRGPVKWRCWEPPRPSPIPGDAGACSCASRRTCSWRT